MLDGFLLPGHSYFGSVMQRAFSHSLLLMCFRSNQGNQLLGQESRDRKEGIVLANGASTLSLGSRLYLNLNISLFKYIRSRVFVVV